MHPQLLMERLGPDSEFERKYVWNDRKKPQACYREDIVARALRKLRWRFFYEPVEYQDPGRLTCKKQTKVCFDYLVFLPGKIPIHIEVTVSRTRSLRRKWGQAVRIEQYWGILVLVIGPDDLDQIEQNPYILEWLVETALMERPQVRVR